MNLPESLRYQLLAVGTPVNNNVGPTIASATTIAPLYYINPISGTVEITTITPPYDGFSGTIVFIPAAAFTLATGGNIGKAATAVAGKAMHMTFDGALWYPSYTS